MLFFDPMYLLFMLPGVALAMWAQWRVKSTFGRYSQVATRKGWTGAQIAQAILDVNGIRDVVIEPSQGMLSDHYDPRAKALRLSPDVYQGRSVAAAGVAAHEVGHAIQHARGFVIERLRIQAAKSRTLEFHGVHVVVRDVGIELPDGKKFVLPGVLGMNLLLPSASGLSQGDIAGVAEAPFQRIWIDGPRHTLSLDLP